MVKEVIWTDQGISDFREVLDYLNFEWNNSVAEEYHERVMDLIETLMLFPNLGTIIKERPQQRKFLITKFNYLVYQVTGSNLYILSFDDTRKR